MKSLISKRRTGTSFNPLAGTGLTEGKLLSSKIKGAQSL